MQVCSARLERLAVAGAVGAGGLFEELGVGVDVAVQVLIGISLLFVIAVTFPLVLEAVILLWENISRTIYLRVSLGLVEHAPRAFPLARFPTGLSHAFVDPVSWIRLVGNRRLQVRLALVGLPSVIVSCLI